MYKEFLELDHRPFPLPSKPWIMTQVWRDMLFMHWPVDAAFVRNRIPEDLELDLFNDQAWISVIPFRATNTRGRFLPLIPFMTAYLELNIRTYVVYQGVPGIYFFRIDANHLPTVVGARAYTGIPYCMADMTFLCENNKYFFSSLNKKERREVKLAYQGEDVLYEVEPGTLDHWLLERYCMYSIKGKHVYRGDIHHDKWKVTNGQVEVITGKGISLFSKTKPIVHFSRRRRAFTYPLEKVK
ncbi:DUF2071 domain-containing protein [Bacillus sp. FJAT-50079]|uniref:YqjF family protein n=1 Tax=Bacillus sp. FJAT-50079 TaxID=2833577 RepID=UPI001BC96581|nr:DUF2071 domain-containing protein [Bacillus sp. FJAT-50079]MBS4208260.1 DUF2071 domain-containing protein [Bacillus sp. FJAT-50079]